MDIKNLHRVYFLGIGGIGMSTIARYFHRAGITVAGYDKTPSALTNELQKEGIHIHFEDDIQQILSAPDLIVYTPAVPESLKEFKHLQNSGLPLIKRAEVLGWISAKAPCIAIAGTHGKTTITGMLAHLLYQSNLGCTALVGGILNNYHSNFLQSQNSSYTVVEADEYDRSFLHIHPQMAVISAMDADHLDIYSDKKNLEQSFNAFAKNIIPDGHLLVKKSIEQKSFNHSVITYSMDEEADYYADNIRMEGKNSLFDLHHKNGVTERLELGMPGRINVENAVAASALALMAGMDESQLRRGLKSFEGIRRRFDYRFQSERQVYIDDYAHHPAEIAAVVKSVRLIYPGKKICGIFQPHLFSRTRDFADAFAHALGLLDEVILLPIYPAREKPIPGIDASIILNQIIHQNKILIEKEQLIPLLEKKNFDVLLTLGAGDIDGFRKPIAQLLSKKLNPALQ